MPENLNFCKNCGSPNERNPSVVYNTGRGYILASMMIGMFGLFGFYGVLRELLRNPLDPAVVVILMIVYSFALLAMFAIPLGMSRRSGNVESNRIGRRESYGQPTSFRSVNTAQLEEPREMPASVTEHTTRTLDQVPLAKD